MCVAYVSTHAPARGAAKDGLWTYLVWAVSTHAPARGATPKQYRPQYRSARFNPRARTGRDRRRGCCPIQQWTFQPTRPHGARRRRERVAVPQDRVSTHAPARGATYWRSARLSCDVCFNPRARTGRDPLVWPKQEEAPKFQPTRPQGARPGWVQHESWLCKVSTHAPARGATARRETKPPVSPCFNPRARTGRDHGAMGDAVFLCDRFNPRARTGRDWPQATIERT